MEEYLKIFLAKFYLIVTSLGINSGGDLINALLVFSGAVIAGTLLSEGLIYLWEYQLSLHSDLTGYRDTLKSRLPMISRFMERRARRNGLIDRLDEEVKTQVTAQRALVTQIRALNDLQSRFVRTVGQETKGMFCYRAIVTNAYVKNYVQEGKRHPLYDDCWAKAQIIEVWAPAQANAIVELRKEYPQAQGFVVDKLEPVQPVPGRGFGTR